jgi:hypothetical protein
MARKRYQREETVAKLRQVLTWQGRSVPDAIRLTGVALASVLPRHFTILGGRARCSNQV